MHTIRMIHKWTGLAIGLSFMFLCFSGLVIVLGKIFNSYAPVFKLAKSFHTSFLIGDSGKWIISISTLLALIEIISGYFLWGERTTALCRSLRKQNKSIWTGIRKNLGFKFPDLLTGLHNAGGFWSGIPLLIMILTCLTWCFGWYSEMVYSLFAASDTGVLFHTLHALHVGSWWGFISRLLWLAAVLIGTSLPITGYILFLRRWKARHTKSYGNH